MLNLFIKSFPRGGKARDASKGLDCTHPVQSILTAINIGLQPTRLTV